MKTTDKNNTHTHRDMKVPEGYFESMEVQIMERIDNDKDVRRPKLIRMITSIAAVMMILLGVMTLWNQDTTTVIDDTTLSEEISYEEMTISDYYAEVSEDDSDLDLYFIED